MGDMDTIEQLIDIAQGLQDKGKLEEALQIFSKAFDMLIDDTGQYALEKNADVTDMSELRQLAPVLFAHSKEYLKRNITAAYVLNAMGVLFAQMKDVVNAQQKFMEAMEYIPDGQDFNDPADNLERLAEEIAALPAESEEE